MKDSATKKQDILVGRIPGLDGLRALSILLVLFSHFGFKQQIPGALGVTIFFFISGFLITSLLLEERATTGSISIKKFYIRRLLRLSPELLFLIAVVGLVSAIIGQPLRLKDYIGSLTYTTNYIYLFELWKHGHHTLHWPQMWSLAVEEHFYITYPLLFSLIVARRNRLIAGLIAVCLFCLCWRSVALVLHFVKDYTYVASEARFDSIAYGCLTAVLLRSNNLVGRLSSWGLVMFLGGGLLLLASIVIRDPFFRESLRYSLQGAAIGLIVSGLLASEQCAVFIRALEFRPLVVLGQLSYGAYLWHLDVLALYVQKFGHEFPTSWLGRFAVALMCIALSFAIAQISYALVAKRVLALRRHFSSHPHELTTGAETSAAGKSIA